MSSSALKPKQQAFVDAYLGVSQRNGTAAAIKAGYSKKTARVQASRLLAKADVRAAVDRGVDKASEKAGLTLVDHMTKLANLRDAAEESNQLSAAVTAEMARGKVSGLYVDRVEHDVAVTLEQLVTAAMQKASK